MVFTLLILLEFALCWLCVALSNNLSLMRLDCRMAMTSDFQSRISKRNTLALGGNLAVTEKSGGRAASAVLRHEISSASSAEFMVTLGLQMVAGVQTTR